jgi:hypothetical protein
MKFQKDTHHDNFGFRDVIIFEDDDREMYLAINSEMDSFNRIDSYFTNKQMPWNKKKTPTIETLKEMSKAKVATLELYGRVVDDEN